MCLSLVHVGCANDDPSLERKGDDIPGSQADGGAPSAATGGADGLGDSVPFCDALTVIRAKCQRCHGSPLKNGAPVPFLTYEDTQAPYSTGDEKYSDVMLPAVEKDIMPFVALNDGANPIMPPVEPLTDGEKDTLVAWLKQGAKPLGGTDCR